VAVARREVRSARASDAPVRASTLLVVCERGGTGVARACGDGRRRGRTLAPRAREAGRVRQRVSSPRMRARRAEPGARLQRVEPACLSGRVGAPSVLRRPGRTRPSRSAARRRSKPPIRRSSSAFGSGRGLDPSPANRSLAIAPSGRFGGRRGDARAEGSLGQRRRDASTFDRGSVELCRPSIRRRCERARHLARNAASLPSVRQLVRCSKDGSRSEAR